MYIIAFVGKSGTGKSHHSISIAKKTNADAIIDDGLLISKNKVLAGKSAKKESTKMAAVKRALFTDTEHAESVKKAIKDNKIQKIVILGTSLRMVKLISEKLDINKVDEIIHIEDVATAEEMNEARRMRDEEGKHVIPVPVVEIRRDFSGYFLHPLRQIKNTLGKTYSSDKSIIRPTFSYMGDYIVSDSVICSISEYEANKTEGVDKVIGVYTNTNVDGIDIYISIGVKYGYNIKKIAKDIQLAVKRSIYHHISSNVNFISVTVKKITF